LEVCQAEWRQFETVQALSILRLEANESGPHAAQNPLAMKYEHLPRLARLVGVDAVELTKHFDAHFPLALHAYKSSNISNMVAWMTAIKGSSDRHLKHQKWDNSELAVASPQYIACMPTTSGLEQKYSSLERLYGARRASMGIDRERGLLDLVCDNGPRQEQRALALFVQCVIACTCH
jgi:hypothetical protein